MTVKDSMFFPLAGKPDKLPFAPRSSGPLNPPANSPRPVPVHRASVVNPVIQSPQVSFFFGSVLLSLLAIVISTKSILQSNCMAEFKKWEV